MTGIRLDWKPLLPGSVGRVTISDEDSGEAAEMKDFSAQGIKRSQSEGARSRTRGDAPSPG